MQHAQLPFSAVVGQDMVKLALLINAVDPLVGGALIRGERGSGKTTVVRALGAILPMQRVVAGCPYRCDPDDPGAMCADCASRDPSTVKVGVERMKIIELPISAPLERVVGGIDIAAALTRGVSRFSPGILAAAHRNVLYLDEVNLATDSVVDALLDVAASGVNTVEREGVSVTHPSRFVLVGTMNPQEGELRPQLLDRFGLCVDVTGLTDINQRADVAEFGAAFDRRDPGFAARHGRADAELATSIETARARLDDVSISAGMAVRICQTAVDAGAAGHRADVVMHHAARALAALRGRRRATPGDLDDAAELALAHRARRPIERRVPAPSSPGDEPPEPLPPRPAPGNVEMNQPRTQRPNTTNGADPPPGKDGSPTPSPAGESRDDSGGYGGSEPDKGGDVGATAIDGEVDIPLIQLPRTRRPRTASGKRMLSEAADRRGRYVAARAQHPITDIAVDATLRVAAPHQIGRGRRPGQPLVLYPDDLRQKVREHKVGSLVVFVVDGSASMAAEQRMLMTKSVILSLLQDAYIRRDRVAAIVFRGREAATVLAPTASVSFARHQLAELSVGGSTPMAHGLWSGYQLIRREQRLDATLRPLLVIVTDGHPNVAMGGGDPTQECLDIAKRIGRDGIDTLLVDSARRSLTEIAVPMYEDLRPTVCPVLAEHMGAVYFSMTSMSAGQLRGVVLRLRARRTVAKMTLAHDR